jgi:hypothetical protein
VHKRYTVSNDLCQKYTGHDTSKDTALQIAWWTPLIGSDSEIMKMIQKIKHSRFQSCQKKQGDKDANIM